MQKIDQSVLLSCLFCSVFVSIKFFHDDFFGDYLIHLLAVLFIMAYVRNYNTRNGIRVYALKKSHGYLLSDSEVPGQVFEGI